MNDKELKGFQKEQERIIKIIKNLQKQFVKNSCSYVTLQKLIKQIQGDER